MNALVFLLLVLSSGIIIVLCLPLTGLERHTFSVLHDLYRELGVSVFIPEDRKGDVLSNVL